MEYLIFVLSAILFIAALIVFSKSRDKNFEKYMKYNIEKHRGQFINIIKECSSYNSYNEYEGSLYLCGDEDDEFCERKKQEYLAISSLIYRFRSIAREELAKEFGEVGRLVKYETTKQDFILLLVKELNKYQLER